MGYTQYRYVSNPGGTPCTFILLAVEMDTPCTSILLAVGMDTSCTSILLVLVVVKGIPMQCTSKLFLEGNFIFIFMYALFPLPSPRFHCVGGCWDRTQDCCNFVIDSQTLKKPLGDLIHYLARSHPHSARSHTQLASSFTSKFKRYAPCTSIDS